MTDENEIKKLEREFAEKIAQLRKDNAENELTQSQLKKVKQAQKLGFKPIDIAKGMKLDYELVNKACHNENSKQNWKKNHKSQRPETIVGSEAWFEHIRRGHQGDGIKRSLCPEGQRIHDERKECPFCFGGNSKYTHTREDALLYLKDRLREIGIEYKRKNGYFPKYVRKTSNPTTEEQQNNFIKFDTNDVSDEIAVVVNGNPLTQDEYEVLDTPDDSDEAATNLLEAEPKEETKTDKVKKLFGIKPNKPIPDEHTRKYIWKLERATNANQTELANLKKKYSLDNGTDND